MNFKKYLFGALSLLTLSACSNEDAPAAPDAGQNGDTYATIRLSFATGSRSTTITPPEENTNSSDGFEIGKDEENKISSLQIILAQIENGSYVAKAVSKQKDNPFYNETSDLYTVTFDNKELLDIAGKDVSIFAICNSKVDFKAGDDLTNAIASTGDGITVEKIEADYAKNNYFLMVNAPETTVKTIPTKKIPEAEVLYANHSSKEKAFDLGTIRVARVAARFDFKMVQNNTYPINDANVDTLIANIKLIEMAPVNVAKDFYYLPRVSDNGTDAGWTICGLEGLTNYVVSPYWDQKTAENLADNIFKNYKYQTPNGESYSTSGLEFTNLDAFASTTGNDDNDENWGNGQPAGFDKTGYKIWRYVTENTLPKADDQKNEKKGISTGIIFKAEIINPAEKSLMKKCMDAGKAIYGFDGIYYGDVESLRLMAYKQDENNAMRKAFVEVWGDAALETKKETTPGEAALADGEATETVKKIEFANEINDCTAEKNAGKFKILRPTKDADGTDHYYTYYLYRNRHFDNGNPAVMAPMEFATVRNNIYKLSVTSISDFGHTDNPGDDPDPEDPNDPDEDPKAYFKVSCYVVPWMVRINSIEF